MAVPPRLDAEFQSWLRGLRRERDLQFANARLESLRLEHDHEQSRGAELEARVGRLEEALRRAWKNRRVLRAHELETEIAGLRKDLRESTRGLAAARLRLERATRRRLRLARRIDELEDGTAQIERAFERARALDAESRGRLGEVAAELDGARKENAELRARNAGLEHDAGRLRDLERDNLEQAARLRAFDETIATEKAYSRDAAKRAETLQHRLDEAQDRVNELIQELRAAEIGRERLGEKVQDAQEREYAASIRLERVREELELVELERDDLRDREREATLENKRWRGELETRVEAAVWKMKAEVARVQEEISGARNEAALARLRAFIANADKELRRVQTAVQDSFTQAAMRDLGITEDMVAGEKLEVELAPLAPEPSAAPPPEIPPPAPPEDIPPPAPAPVAVAPAAVSEEELPLDEEPVPGGLTDLLLGPLERARMHLRRALLHPAAADAPARLKAAYRMLHRSAQALRLWESYAGDGDLREEDFDVSALAARLTDGFSRVFRSRRLKLSTDLPRGLPTVHGDPRRLRIALFQLLRNAVEALEKGGTLRLRASHDPARGVVLRFEDDGPGYPAPVLDSPWTPFVHHRPNRPGLGLPAARAIARRLGGTFSIENLAGGGAAATFVLPPARAVQASNE